MIIIRPKIFITRRIPAKIHSFLAETCEVRMWDQEELPVPREVLEKEVAEADGLFALLTEMIDEPLLNLAPKLKVISNMAVGYNNVDIEAATKRGILVTNTPDVLTDTTADLTFALLLATARRVVEAEHILRSGQWKTWSPMMLTGQDVHGATLGIVGLGRIGQAVAKRAKGFAMNILYHNRTRQPELESSLGIQYAGLEELLRASDFVCLLTPYTKETKGLIGKRELAWMKPSSILINTSRGGIVDEQALYEALQSGGIWAAGLDVFEQEPVPVDHPLLRLPNVVALPHIGSASIQTRTAMASLAAVNVLKGVLGDVPPNVVNKELLKD